jgi:hypothetical protein
MPKPNASIVLSSRDATGGRPQNGNLYNQLLFNAENQNIIQGQVHSVELSEVNFPYDIPNVQAGFNEFFFEYTSQGPAGQIAITIEPGFYTPVELVAEINAQIALESAALPTPEPLANQPICDYDDTSNRFSFEPAQTPTAPGASNGSIFSSYTFYDGGVTPRNKLGKDLLSIMGFQQSQGAGYAGGGNSNPLLVAIPVVGTGIVFSGQSAPVLFTQYIDICSPQLCKFQYFRDGSTTNLARRSDVICRLYISNNVATQEEEGTRPFVIHRQFFNSRKMRWTADNAVGTIDINLYDDVGQPLTTAWAPRPYQITFNCYEDEKKEAGNVTGDGSIMEKFANYVARNEGLWSSRSYPLS